MVLGFVLFFPRVDIINTFQKDNRNINQSINLEVRKLNKNKIILKMKDL